MGDKWRIMGWIGFAQQEKSRAAAIGSLFGVLLVWGWDRQPRQSLEGGPD